MSKSFFTFCCALSVSSSAIAATASNTDWALYGNDYANQRHSELTQINHDTVGKLKLAWEYHTGKKGSFQASPVVLDGVMYVSTAFNDVVALDAASGKEIWRYQHKLTTDKTCCGPANRGVAVANGVVYEATIDGRLIALKQATGELLWDTAIHDVSINLQETLSGAKAVMAQSDVAANVKSVGGTGHTFNMAPQVFDGMVFVGSTGTGYGLHLDGDKGLQVIGQGDGRTGLRGFLAAFDAQTGKEIWRWYNVADGQWVGEWRQTTNDGVPLNRDIAWEKQQHAKFPETWQLGGGSIMATPALDPATGVLFFGTGNPAPNMDDSTRPGDNLHTSSVVALDSKTGKLLWAYQQVPHDRWGYDASSPAVLFDAKVDGKTVKAVGQAGKTGWFYVLDRATGKLLLKSEAFVPQSNLFENPTEQGVKIAPSIAGGSNWSPVAFNPADSSVFVAGIHSPATYYRKTLPPPTDNKPQPWQSYSYFEFDPKDKYGLLTALDVQTGKQRWQFKTPHPLLGGVLHTAGGLVFSGEGSGEFFALDDKTGKKLWSYQQSAGVNAPPMTYQVRGKQYVAVAAGGNKLFGFAEGDALLVFAVEEGK